MHLMIQTSICQWAFAPLNIRCSFVWDERSSFPFPISSLAARLSPSSPPFLNPVTPNGELILSRCPFLPILLGYLDECPCKLVSPCIVSGHSQWADLGKWRQEREDQLNSKPCIPEKSQGQSAEKLQMDAGNAYIIAHFQNCVGWVFITQE